MLSAGVGSRGCQRAASICAADKGQTDGRASEAQVSSPWIAFGGHGIGTPWKQKLEVAGSSRVAAVVQGDSQQHRGRYASYSSYYQNRSAGSGDIGGPQLEAAPPGSTHIISAVHGDIDDDDGQ